MRYGTVIGLCHYRGDKEIACNSTVIQNAVSAFQSNPAGFAIDFGVTDDGRTLVVEVNDGISLGCYGLQDTLYAELLTARWAELTGTKDILKKR